VRHYFESRAPDRLALRALRKLVPDVAVEVLHEEPPDGRLGRHFREAEARRLAETGRRYKGATPASRRHVFLYAVARSLNAGHVVETGVANGFTSAFLLAALERSGRGALHSIDLPFFDDPETGDITAAVAGTELETVWEYTPVAPGREAGWVVPDDLRPRWDLRLGDAKELLPALLEELGEIDFFFHDSTHTREHILWELELAWPRVRPGGVVAADDVFLRGHEALPEFARGKGLDFVTYGGVGYVRKP
jgi:predicted O-methyltransferase YrrM